MTPERAALPTEAEEDWVVANFAVCAWARVESDEDAGEEER